MTGFYYAAALIILLNIAASLARVFKGPTRADRMMAAQLIGTGGVAILVMLSLADPRDGILDVALLLALLAAFTAVAFVKSLSRDGAGDPEADA